MPDLQRLLNQSLASTIEVSYMYYAFRVWYVLLAQPGLSTCPITKPEGQVIRTAVQTLDRPPFQRGTLLHTSACKHEAGTIFQAFQVHPAKRETLLREGLV